VGPLSKNSGIRTVVLGVQKSGWRALSFDEAFMGIRRSQVLAGLLGGTVACAAFSASADTIGTLSIGEQSNGGASPAGNLATYNFSTNDNNQNINLTTVLTATSDPAGEITTALKGNTSHWFVTSGNIYAVVMETGSLELHGIRLMD
jgi:hypothetical protein